MSLNRSSIKITKSYVKDKHPSRYDEWFDTLSKECRELNEWGGLASSWYPATLAVVEPRIEICKLFFGGNIPKGSKAIAHYGAEQAIKGIYKFVIKVGSPEWFLERAHQHLLERLRPCNGHIVKQEKKDVLWRLTNLSDDTGIVGWGLIGFSEFALQTSGCKNIVSSFSPAADGEKHAFDIHLTWE